MDKSRRATITQGDKVIAVPAQDTLSRAQGVTLTPWRGVVEPEPTPPPLRQSRAAAPLVPEDLLASLLSGDLARARAAVPDISPERTERLARALHGVIVARDNGGDVTVNVTQVAPQAPQRTSRVSTRGGIAIKNRRQRLEYIEAARRGDKFDPTFKRLGGSRNEMHALFTANKAVLTHQDAK
jgi:hypothetical protein